MSLGTASPLRLSEPNTQMVCSSFTGAGAADCVKVDGDGITSLAYSAATGEFLLTFTDVGVSLLYADIKCHTADGAAAVLGKISVGSLSISAKTVAVEFWDNAGAKINPASANIVQCLFIWKTTT